MSLCLVQLLKSVSAAKKQKANQIAQLEVAFSEAESFCTLGLVFGFWLFKMGENKEIFHSCFKEIEREGEFNSCFNQTSSSFSTTYSSRQLFHNS